MPRVYIIAEENKLEAELLPELAEKGFICSSTFNVNKPIEEIMEQAPDLVLLVTDSYARLKELSQGIKQTRPLPVIGLIHRDMLDSIADSLIVDDFVIRPYDVEELVFRLKRLLHETNNKDGRELIRCGDLAIDLARCEVSVGDRQIVLTFREYELLKFLAASKGQVFTREALLNLVWGYEYYGGDRTVDVHIRRLRSKIEDSTHTFIETIRNIGYRFKKDA